MRISELFIQTERSINGENLSEIERNGLIYKKVKVKFWRTWKGQNRFTPQ